MDAFWYMSTLTEPKTREFFDSVILGIKSYDGKNKALEFYTSECPLICFDFSKDGNGTRIGKEHPLYELSDAINAYTQGQVMQPKDVVVEGNDLESFFQDRGKHFCAGYLSRFGELWGAGSKLKVVRYDFIPRNILRLTRKDEYSIQEETFKAALDAYNEMKQ